MEMNLVMAKMLWTYDLELVNRDIDWLNDGKVHVLWWKPALNIRSISARIFRNSIAEQIDVLQSILAVMEC
jgi:hypothetical protein